MKRVACLGAVAGALLLAPTWNVARADGTGTVKGTVSESAPPGQAVAGAVVMIDGPAPAAAPAGHAVMDQRNEAFVPHVLTVAAGTTVDFANHDPVLHNVFSASPAKRFDLGMYGEGESKSVTFDAPGVVRVRCNAHPKMEAFIVVHANPHFAVTDAHGGYTISGVPAGSYRLRIWHETLAEKELPVVVRDGQVTALDVRLEARR